MFIFALSKKKLMKTLFYRVKMLPKYKFIELQIIYELVFSFAILLNFDFNRTQGHIFIIDVDLFNLFKFHLYKTEKNDHAGLTFHFKILCIEFIFQKKDTRHWDFDKDYWESSLSIVKNN